MRVARRRHRADGVGDGPLAGARRGRARRSTTGPRTGAGPWPTSSARAVADTAREAAAGADVAITMLADGPAVTATWDGPDGLLAGARSGVGARRHEHRPAGDDPAPSRARSASAAPASLDAPVSGSVHLAEIRAADDHGRRVGGGPRARPAGAGALVASITHVGPLGSGAALKLAGERADLRAQQQPERGARPRRAGRHRPRRRLRRLRRERPRARRSSATSGPRSSTRTATPVAFSLDLAAKDLRLILELAGRLGVPMPQARVEPGDRSARRPRGSARTATHRRSRRTCDRCRGGSDERSRRTSRIGRYGPASRKGSNP